MKSGQLSVRKLFIVIAVIAAFIAFMTGIMRHRQQQAREALIKGYRDARAVLESDPSADAERARRALDENWRQNTHEPIPEYPGPK